MHEYLGQAIVLDVLPRGRTDARVVLFMEKTGKLSVRAQSLRKITSKLAAHLQPGNLSRVRVIEKGTLMQVVDALKTDQITKDLEELRRLAVLLAEGQPEPELWRALAVNSLSWKETLNLLGWDPNHAHCRPCRHSKVSAFHMPTQEFFCSQCASQLRENELIFI